MVCSSRSFGRRCAKVVFLCVKSGRMALYPLLVPAKGSLKFRITTNSSPVRVWIVQKCFDDLETDQSELPIPMLGKQTRHMLRC